MSAFSRASDPQKTSLPPSKVRKPWRSPCRWARREETARVSFQMETQIFRWCHIVTANYKKKKNHCISKQTRENPAKSALCPDSLHQSFTQVMEGQAHVNSSWPHSESYATCQMLNAPSCIWSKQPTVGFFFFFSSIPRCYPHRLEQKRIYFLSQSTKQQRCGKQT